MILPLIVLLSLFSVSQAWGVNFYTSNSTANGWAVGNNNNAPGIGGGGPVDEAARERNTMLRPVVLKALEALTKVNRGSVKEWEDWWRTDGARFMSGR